MADSVTSEAVSVSDLSGTQLAGMPQGCVNVSGPAQSHLDHPEDLVSFATQRKFKEISDVYLLTPLFLLSLPLNIVNMIVFCKQGLKERINLCLFFLSLADLVVMVGFFELKLDSLYAAITGTPFQMVVTKYNINYMIFSVVAFVYISEFLSTLIAVERCMCVVFPLKARSMVQTRTTAGIIAAGHAVIFGAFCVNASRWTVACFYDHRTGSSLDAYYPSQFYLDNKAFLDVYESVIFGIFVPGVSVLGVAVCTVVTVVKLRQMKKWRQQSSSSDKHGGKDVTVTRMLVGSSVLFVLCSAPPLSFHLLRPFLPQLSLHGKLYNTFHLLLTMQHPFFYLNSSCNFFVYFYFGTKFRLTVKRMCCRSSGRLGGKTETVQASTVVSGVAKGVE